MSGARRVLVLGSRGSPLALRQADWAKTRIEASGRAVRIETIRTSGDRFTDQPLPGLGGQGVFVKEIEEALLRGSIDIAVHSMKDLPTAQPGGLLVACVPARADARDLLLARGARTLRALPTGSIVGTGSPRRACQILAIRPDLALRDLRGNVGTRVRKWETGEFDAIVLAAAGVERLGLSLEARPLGLDEMLPAAGQGALAIETRTDDGDARAALSGLHHAPTAAAVDAERAFLRALGGGCRAPIAAFAEVLGGTLRLRGLAADPAGRRRVHGERSGAPAAAAEIGAALAQDLLARGAADLLPRAPATAAGPA